MTTREYVLGTGSDELARLALQHRLWSDAAHALWHRARLAPGQRALDVGCGPGFAAFDLAQMVTPAGHVVGLDESEGFVSWMREQARVRQLPQLAGVVGDVHDLAGTLAGEDAFDLAYARWLLCFAKDPRRVLEEIAGRLTRGGRLCVHDYFNYRSMSAAPRRPAFTKAVHATADSWEARGGDTDVMGLVPAACERLGLRVTHLSAHLRICRGEDTMFVWPDLWWRTFAPKLVAMGRLTPEDERTLYAELDEIRSTPGQFVMCPPVFELIAEKR